MFNPGLLRTDEEKRVPAATYVAQAHRQWWKAGCKATGSEQLKTLATPVYSYFENIFLPGAEEEESQESFFPLIMKRICSRLWIFAHREIKGCHAQKIRTKDRLFKCQFMLLSLTQIWHKPSHMKETIISETIHLVTCFWNHEPQAEAWCVFEKRLCSCVSQTLLQLSVVSKHCFWILVLSNFQSDHK